MKRIKILTIALGLILLGSAGANAQKIGYVDAEAIIYALPEAKTVADAMQKWQVDSLGGAYQALAKDYREKDSIYKLPATTASIKSMLEKELGQLGMQLQNWQEIAGNLSQQKQAVMLDPLNKKVQTAINAVAKEKGMTYVLHPQALIVAPPGDDITMAVATRLGIKPNNPAPAAGAAPATTAPKK